MGVADFPSVAAGLLLTGVIGLAAGSVIATLSIRWPLGRSLSGRSACDACGRPLRALELVPVLSYVAAGGRCRSCGAAIDRRHPLLEGTAALLGMAAWAASPGPLGAAGALLAFLLLALAVLDVEHFWLPDRLTIPLLLLGLALGLDSFPDRALAAGTAAAVLLALRELFARVRGKEGLGLGDVKLAAALGAWLGWPGLPPLVLLASLLGLASVSLRLVGARPPGALASAGPVPFGACLAAAALPIWLTRAGGLW